MNLFYNNKNIDYFMIGIYVIFRVLTPYFKKILIISVVFLYFKSFLIDISFKDINLEYLYTTCAIISMAFLIVALVLHINKFLHVNIYLKKFKSEEKSHLIFLEFIFFILNFLVGFFSTMYMGGYFFLAFLTVSLLFICLPFSLLWFDMLKNSKLISIITRPIFGVILFCLYLNLSLIFYYTFGAAFIEFKYIIIAILVPRISLKSMIHLGKFIK